MRPAYSVPLGFFHYFCKKYTAMKYLVRSIKYFFYFTFLTSVILLVFVLTGMVEADINSMFDGGYDALWKIAMIFAIAAAAYPKVGFITRDVHTERSWEDIHDEIISNLRDREFCLESEDGNTMTFRYRSTVGRLSRMFEDRITLTRTQDGFEMEGLRKDVLRIAMALEYRLNPHEED